jgi:lysophospholipase L1-like esterase
MIPFQKTILLYFFMFLVTLLLLVTGGELLARFLVIPQSIPQLPPSSIIDPYQPNPYVFYSRPYLYFHLPHASYIQARSTYQVNYEINSLGFRGPEISPKTQPRLITIGDSITEGHGNPFEKTFSYRLGQNFRHHNWEMINMGVQGASPIYYALNLERYLAVQPDAVLIVIFENDLFDDRFREATFFTLPILDDAEILLPKEANLIKRLLSKSRLYVLLKKGWQHFFHSPVEKIIANNQRVTYTTVEQEAINNFTAQQTAIDGFKHKYLVAPAVFAKQWEMTQAYLDYVVDGFRRQGVTVMLANISITGQEPGLNPAYSEHAQLLDEHLSSWAKVRQIPFLSLLPTIAQIVEQYQPFYPQVVIVDDGHPTSQTHALIANALQPWVINNLPHH